MHPQHTAVFAGGVDGKVYAVPLLAYASDSGLGGLSASQRAKRQRRAPAAEASSTAHSGALRSLVACDDGERLLSSASENGVWVWDAHSLSLLMKLQPTLHADLLLLFRRPTCLRPGAESSVPAADSKSDSKPGASVGECMMAPFKKFAEAAPTGTELVERNASSMGCVPCELGPLSADAETWDGGAELAGWVAGTAPAFGGAPWPAPNALDGLGPAESEAEASASATAIAAEATVRQLRAQLAQLAAVNSELYEMAVDRTLG